MQDKRETILRLPPEEIRPNPFQPRQDFEETGLAELTDSVRRHGVLQPLLVRRRDGEWELVAGERRLRAARQAGLREVPCVEIEADDEEAALLALVENLQRRDLHFFEEAWAISEYLRRSGSTQEAAAEKLGKSAPAIANKLRLLRLSPECREAVRAAALTERHARCLLRLPEDAERLRAAREIARRGYTVAQAEQYIQRLLEEGRPHRTFILKDVRLFLNTLDRSLKLIREAGLDAGCVRTETEDDILLTIRIPKRRREEGTTKRRQKRPRRSDGA